MRKGSSEIATAALYVGITITAVSTAVTVGVPALEEMQDAAAISSAEELMHEIDSQINTVAAEGEGSARTIDVDLDRGEIFFDNDSERLVYELETGAEVISPQTSVRDGNVILSSNADVSVQRDEVNGNECYMMENEHIRACIRDIPEEDSEDVDTSELVELYEFKGEEEDLEFEGDIEIELNENEDTSHGDAFTQAETGEFIGTGEVIATMQSEQGFTYDIYYRLPTGADFIEIDVRNFR